MHLKRLVPLLALLAAASALPRGSQAPWVSLDASGCLVYRTLPRGDRIADFSYPGYMGGGVLLPQVPVALRVTPSGGDDTAAIQRAIDQVSALPLKNGFRSAVLLAPGMFLLGGSVTTHASGVVCLAVAAPPVVRPFGSPAIRTSPLPSQAVKKFSPSATQPISSTRRFHPAPDR